LLLSHLSSGPCVSLRYCTMFHVPGVSSFHVMPRPYNSLTCVSAHSSVHLVFSSSHLCFLDVQSFIPCCVPSTSSECFHPFTLSVSLVISLSSLNIPSLLLWTPFIHIFLRVPRNPISLTRDFIAVSLRRPCFYKCFKTRSAKHPLLICFPSPLISTTSCLITLTSTLSAP
jgi:hypothetical protein